MPYPDSPEAHSAKCDSLVEEKDVVAFKWSEELPVKEDESGRFKIPSTRVALDKLSKKTFAESTERKIEWAVELFRQWRYARLGRNVVEHEIQNCNVDAIGVAKSDLSYCLCTFLNEIKRVNGKEYSAKSLYRILIMMQFFFEKKGLMYKLIDGKEFQNVKFTLDNLMKARTLDRVGVIQRVSIITEGNEEKMWDGGTLGEDTPEKLRDTVLYLLRISCALRGGQEHRNLRCPPYDPQVTVCTDSNGQKYLLYREDVCSKVNQGGLTGRAHDPKSVKVYGNVGTRQDIVRLYQKYISLLPKEPKSSALYKYGLRSPKTPCTWYADKLVGVNMLKKTVSRLTKCAGLCGHFTNHSLRATAATRLFHKGVDEQVIKEVTGHRSDAVQSYKRTSEEQLKHASESLAVSKCAKIDSGGKAENGCELKVGEEVRKNVRKPYCVDCDVATLDPEECVLMPNSRLSIHKKSCAVKDANGECPPLCSVLKQIDRKCEDVSVKRMKLSLKYRKKKQ